MPIMLAKGNRASQAKVASERTPDVGYCSSKDTFYHGVKLHAVAEQRSGQLPLLTRAGLTSGSENDLQALRRVLPEITGGVLCGDKAYCDGPLKEQLEGAACRDSGVGPDHSSQKGERAEDAPGSRQALFGGHRPVETTNRVSFQLDRRENGHSTGLKGAFLPGVARACVRSACCCNADSRSQPLIRIEECRIAQILIFGNLKSILFLHYTSTGAGNYRPSALHSGVVHPRWVRSAPLPKYSKASR